MRGLPILAMALACWWTSSACSAETWRVVTEEGYQPYNYSDPQSGRPAGLDVELVSAVLDDLGVSAEWKLLPWARVKYLLDSGQADLGFQFLGTPERRKQYLLVGPLRDGGNVFACRRGCGIRFQALADLKPYRIATVFGYAYGQEFERAGLEVDDSATRSDLLIPMLVAGRVDLIVGDPLLLQTQAEKQGLPDVLEFLEPPLSIEPRYVGFRHGAQDKAARFERSLAKLRADGTLERIIQRWSRPPDAEPDGVFQ